jgi:hypothetical protein
MSRAEDGPNAPQVRAFFHVARAAFSGLDAIRTKSRADLTRLVLKTD